MQDRPPTFDSVTASRVVCAVSESIRLLLRASPGHTSSAWCRPKSRRLRSVSLRLDEKKTTDAHFFSLGSRVKEASPVPVVGFCDGLTALPVDVPVPAEEPPLLVDPEFEVPLPPFCCDELDEFDDLSLLFREMRIPATTPPMMASCAESRSGSTTWKRARKRTRARNPRPHQIFLRPANMPCLRAGAP